MAKIFRFIFSAEMIFCLYLYSGTFKTALNLPVDATLVLIGISMMQGLFVLFKRKSLHSYSAIAIYVYFLFVSLALISLWYTPGEIYATEKVMNLILTVGWAFCGPLILYRDNDSLKRFLLSCIAIGLAMAVTFISQYGFKSGGFVRVWGSSYLTFGRALGLSAVIVLTMYLLKDIRVKLSLLMITLFTYGIVMSGGRMPLISFAITLFLFAASTIKIRLKDGKLFISKGFIYLLIAGTMLFLILPYTNYNENITFSRLSLLTSDGDDLGASANERVSRFNAAIEMIKERPLFGSGIGSFPIYYGDKDERSYPHNIVLEVVSELGILGASIFATLIVLCLKSLGRSNSPYKTTILAGACFLFLNANVSGDFNDNRIFIAFLASMCTAPMLTRVESKPEKDIQLARRLNVVKRI